MTLRFAAIAALAPAIFAHAITAPTGEQGGARAAAPLLKTRLASARLAG